MENETVGTNWKHIMNWGAITGIALIASGLIFYMLGVKTSKISQFLSYIILIGGIYIGTKKYRDDIGNGMLSYSKSLITGTQIAFFASILLGFYMFIFFTYVDASMITEILNQQEQAMIDKDMPTENIEDAMNIMRKFMTPTSMSATTVVSFTLIGFFVSLIVSLFVKKEDKSFEGGFLDKQ